MSHKSFYKPFFIHLSIVIFAFGATSAVTESHPTPLKIGYITDLSGPGAFFGAQSQRGAKLAELEFSSIHKQSEKQSLHILIEDTKGKTTDAVTAVMKLLNQEKVDAIICDLTALCTAISQKVQQAKKVLIYHSPSCKIRETNPYAFRNFMDYKIGCQRAVNEWQKQGISSFATIMANSEFGELCETGAKLAAPKEKLLTYNYNPGDDLRSLITVISTKIKNDAKVEALLFTGFENDFVNFFTLLRELKITIKTSFPEVILSKNLITAARDNLKHALIYGFEPISTEFKTKIKEQLQIKEEPNQQGIALAYNAVTNISYALTNCGGSQNPECLVKELKAEPKSKLLGFRGYGIEEEYPTVFLYPRQFNLSQSH